MIVRLHVASCFTTQCSCGLSSRECIYDILRCKGSIQCILTDHCRYSRDLPQGGMEVSCKLHLLGDDKCKYFDKVKTFAVEPLHDQGAKTREVMSSLVAQSA